MTTNAQALLFVSTWFPKIWELYIVRIQLVRWDTLAWVVHYQDEPGVRCLRGHTSQIRRHLPRTTLTIRHACASTQGILFATSLWTIARAARRRLGPGASLAFCVLTASQFHLPFYASRPLPNTMACLLTNLGLAAWVKGGRPHLVIALLASAAVRWRWWGFGGCQRTWLHGPG